jgi:thiol-disulfide isomerase/thioredoxin
MFLGKAKKRAGEYLKLVNILFEDIIQDEDLSVKRYCEPMAINEILLGLCSLLVASFCGDPKAAKKMIEAYKKQVYGRGIIKEVDISISQRINKYYSEYREAGIRIQENTANWLQPTIDKFAELTEQFLRMPNKDKNKQVIAENIQFFVVRSRKIKSLKLLLY